MLVLNKICKNYDTKCILKDIDLILPKGKITSFIGANGAGKSTLLSIISKLVCQNCGDVYINDININSIHTSEFAKMISTLKQTNNVNIRITVRELVSFGRFPYSKGKLTEHDNEKINEALTYLKLKDIQDYYIDELSGGQRQRAFIAMILAQDTDIILLDEPLNNLDMKHSVQIMKILRKIADELDKTVVLVIHDINFASCYSDYIAALKNGQLIKFGTVDSVITEANLEEIYDMKFDIQVLKNKRICNYFM